MQTLYYSLPLFAIEEPSKLFVDMFLQKEMNPADFTVEKISKRLAAILRKAKSSPAGVELEAAVTNIAKEFDILVEVLKEFDLLDEVLNEEKKLKRIHAIISNVASPIPATKPSSHVQLNLLNKPTSSTINDDSNLSQNALYKNKKK